MSAVISACGRYRYRLTREWGEGPRVLFVMLNPSTADASIDDPTIRRCVGFAKALGAGSLEVVNVFAWRATDPAELAKAIDANGPDNERHIGEAMAGAHAVIAAWGAHPMARRRSHIIEALAVKHGKTLLCLKRTKDGAPSHPLYLPASAWPTPLHPARSAHLGAAPK